MSLTGLFVLLLRRLILAGIVASTVSMVTTCLLKDYLPLNYWAYANDCIIEQFAFFLVPYCAFKPCEALLSLVFHVGVPVGFAWLLSKRVRRCRHTADNEG